MRVCIKKKVLKSKMKILKTILKGIYTLIFLVLMTSVAFILLTAYDVIPGHNFYVVLSGSMEPTINMGSVVGVREEKSYEVKDIVTVQIPENPNETYTHRIIEISEENEYTTKGDANEFEDPETISEDLIIGKKFFSIPLIGYIINFAQQPTGFVLMVVVPATIIITSELNSIKTEIVKFFKSRKEKKNEN